METQPGVEIHSTVVAHVAVVAHIGVVAHIAIRKGSPRSSGLFMKKK